MALALWGMTLTSASASNSAPQQVPHPHSKNKAAAAAKDATPVRASTTDTNATDSATDSEELSSPEAVTQFETFTIGQTTYTNVNILSRTSTDVFLRHQGGLANLKVEELEEGLLEQLGYTVVKKRHTVGPIANMLSETITKARTPEGMAELTEKMTAVLPGDHKLTPEQIQTLIAQISSGHLPKPVLVTVSLIFVTLPLIYFFSCYTARMICEKTGVKPGAIIWIPFASAIPLAKAAGMPGWSGLLFYVPFVNTIFFIVWSFKICAARSKSALAALCLIFPPTFPGAWLYLAYSK
jgi:hypothetical protein